MAPVHNNSFPSCRQKSDDTGDIELCKHTSQWDTMWVMSISNCITLTARWFFFDLIKTWSGHMLPSPNGLKDGEGIQRNITRWCLSRGRAQRARPFSVDTRWFDWFGFDGKLALVVKRCKECYIYTCFCIVTCRLCYWYHLFMIPCLYFM